MWKSGIGGNPKAKRLKLQADNDGLFSCLVHSCERGRYHSKRGCRKHVYTKHGWYYFFEEKLGMHKVFPSLLTLGAVHISYLKEAKHQTCRCF